MKTTVDIPDDSLRELMAYTKAETKRSAIVLAVNDFNRRHRMSRLARYSGTFKDFISQDDLKNQREDRQP